VNNPGDSGFQRKSALPYKHKIDDFYRNIDVIANSGNKIITIDNLKSHTSAVLLTFDDGGKSALIIADYLEKYNLKGHFFITTSLIGDKYFLNEDEILYLHKKGHIIGSHSHTHPNVFSSLTYDEMVNEWIVSRQMLENILNVPVKICSIPGGDSNKNSYLSAKACGYEYIFDSEPVLSLRSITGITVLGRVCPKSGTNIKTIKNLTQFKGIKRMLYIRRFKNMVKRIVFPLYSKIHNSDLHEK
jgi:peptidoglycan/xylan/chitin deacetylase (PgdA/CDA1 family)